MLTTIRQDVKRNAELEKNKPRCTIIGSSIIRNLKPESFSRKVLTEKYTDYTIPEAADRLKKIEHRPDVIVYQLLSNDLKKDPENVCLRKLEELVKATKEKKPETKIIISLPPNRSDSQIWNNRTNVINAGVESMFAGDDTVYICDNSNLSFRGNPSRKHILDDGVHPTPLGDKVLFSNLRQAVEEVLTLRRVPQQ